MRLRVPGMLATGLRDHILDVEFQTHSGVKFSNTNLDVGMQIRERVDTLQQLASELFLRGFRKRCGLG